MEQQYMEMTEAAVYEAPVQRKPLIGLTLQQLRLVCEEAGLKPFAAKQIARWLYTARATDIEQMTDLPKAGRARLSELGYVVGLRKPLRREVSTDGTVKYLFPGVNGRDVEAVMIPEADRATLCVSSQAGCKMNCSFCMTGRQGFHGNLSTADIINQVLSVRESEKLTNIVFMGMGEPTDNLSAVLMAIEILTAPWGFGWSPKRITVSTVGRTKELKKILDETKVHIAVSLHSPYGPERASLMPVEKAYPTRELLDLLRGCDFAHQRRLSFEYIVFKGINDDVRHCRDLAKLLKGLDCRVNLIRFHAIPDSPLRPAPMAAMERFRDQLNADGVVATIRSSRGEDISAACGMLAGKQKEC